MADDKWSAVRVKDEYSRLVSYGYTAEQIEPWLRWDLRKVTDAEDIEEGIRLYVADQEART